MSSSGFRSTSGVLIMAVGAFVVDIIVGTEKVSSDDRSLPGVVFEARTRRLR